ncbi:MAG: hypothetical protein HYW26_05340 [Candidatus Aenigmarchaeota archaeon]|nr:hypothetical protein [Candidatus Aenigmarchaeota archaeon]
MSQKEEAMRLLEEIRARETVLSYLQEKLRGHVGDLYASIRSYIENSGMLGSEIGVEYLKEAIDGIGPDIRRTGKYFSRKLRSLKKKMPYEVIPFGEGLGTLKIVPRETIVYVRRRRRK